MAIRVRHEPSARTQADVATAIGVGQRRERNIVRRLQVEAQQRQIDAAELAQRRDISARNIRQQIDLSAEAQEAELRRDFSKEAFGIRSQADLEKIKFSSDLNERVLARRKLEAENTEWVYTPAQLRKLDALQQSQAVLTAEFNRGERGKEEFEQLSIGIDEAIAGELPHKQKRQPTPRDIMKQLDLGDGTVWDQKKGVAYLHPKVKTQIEANERNFEQAETIMGQILTMTKDGNVDFNAATQRVYASYGMPVPPGLLTGAGPDLTFAAEDMEDIFKKAIKGQPQIKIARKGIDDDRFGEEAYTAALQDAVAQASAQGIDPATAKAGFDALWDAEFRSERGQTFQKFVDRQTFQKTITATNPTTGEKIISSDGGKTWQPLR